MPRRQLNRAVAALRKLPQCSILDRSSIYLSRPLGVRAQPIYYNMVIAIQTSLPAKKLLRHCQSIENKQQRTRKIHWGARTLDIDILLYGTKSINLHNLRVPHPHMLARDFVLVPLLEIAPLVSLPDGQLASSYLTSCKKHVIPIQH